jgi:hypothetical protein
MEAQHVIAEQRARAGVSDEVLVDALDASASPAPEAESEEELYRGSVRRYVEALGGRVEGRDAVFAEGRVQLPELGG